MKEVLIVLPAGIGDVIYCQKIAKTLTNNGYDVCWPLKDSITYISDYIDFSGLNKYPTTPDYITLNLRDCHVLFPEHPLMNVKYKYCGLDDSDWRQYVKFNRNYEKEKELYEKLCGNYDEYVVVNNMFGTPPTHVRYDIPKPNAKNIVYMDILEGYSVFDWCMIFENAKEIHTIETSINYIIDFLDIKATKLDCYSRHKPTNFFHVKGLWKKNWNYKLWEDLN